MWLLKMFKRFTCPHTKGYFRRNIYGDEVFYANARSVYQCCECDKYIYKPELNKSEVAGTIDLLHMANGLPADLQKIVLSSASVSPAVITEHFQTNNQTQYDL